MSPLLKHAASKTSLAKLENYESCSRSINETVNGSHCFTRLFFNQRHRRREIHTQLTFRTRLLETEYETLPFGETGDESLTSIPFQINVLSWYPRALYYAEQCETIIDLAKPELKPSTLALREGETEENIKGIKTSSGMFQSATQDKSGTLDVIEERIARAKMLPRTHGESKYYLWNSVDHFGWKVQGKEGCLFEATFFWLA